MPVNQVDGSAYDDLATLLADQGIEFTTLTQVMEKAPDWQRNIWQLFSIIERDIPDPEPGEPTSFSDRSSKFVICFGNVQTSTCQSSLLHERFD